MIKIERNPHIDLLKGIAIITVVIGHCWTLDSSVRNFIYSFHMPLFFCISGYLFSTKAPFGKFVISKAKSVLKPYAFYYLCSYLCAVLIFKTPMGILDGIKGLLLGGNYCGKVLNSPLWYLPIFFIASVVFYLIIKIRWRVARYILIIAGAVASVPFNRMLLEWFPDKATPFNIQALLPALFFMFAGHEFRNLDLAKIKSKLGNRGVFALVLVMLYFGMLMSRDNLDQIISLFMTYEFYIYPLLIIPFIVFFACGTRNEYIEYIGAQSITILGFHRLLLYSLQRIPGLGEFLNVTPGNRFVVTLFISAFCIFVICTGKKAYLSAKGRRLCLTAQRKEKS